MRILSRVFLSLFVVGLLVGGLVGPAEAHARVRHQSLHNAGAIQNDLITAPATDLINGDRNVEYRVNLLMTQEIQPWNAVSPYDNQLAYFSGTLYNPNGTGNVDFEVGFAQDLHGIRTFFGERGSASFACDPPASQVVNMHECLGPYDANFANNNLVIEVLYDSPSQEWVFIAGWDRSGVPDGPLIIGKIPAASLSNMSGESFISEESVQSNSYHYQMAVTWLNPATDYATWQFFLAQLLPPGWAPTQWTWQATDPTFIYCPGTNAHFQSGKPLGNPLLWGDGSTVLNLGLTAWCTVPMTQATP